MNFDHYWLLTWTTYATWLPGDRRGFVSNVADTTGHGERHNSPGEPCDADLPALHRWMSERVVGSPILLTAEQAELLVGQFKETAGYRGWSLPALAVMTNHVHLVVGAQGSLEPDTVLRDFKSYASRCLNKVWGKPPSGTWWTESGSRRRLPDERAVDAAIRYVRNQSYPLVIWIESDRE